MRRVLVTLAALAAWSAGCAVFVDTDGFTSGGPGAGDAGTAPADADASDAAPEPGPALNDGVDGAAPDGTAPEGFVDMFDRADGVVGNGWIENESGVFSISGGRVVAKSGNWVTRYLYRPANEDVRDVETSVEIAWATTPPENCDATLILRAQRADGKLSAYATFINDRKEISISRIDRGVEQYFGSRSLPEPINTTDTYRLRFRVEGTMPVVLVSTFERSTTSGWTTMATYSLTDDDTKRIEAAGSVGVTSDQYATFSYDTFTRTNL
ncbi:MAG: hypothetical protein KIT84_00285 [Labilithrix sp.]|nr:hypothetical protein [Labilithrix sp.]MCW5809420.1 hypothetical protein [Labilithrix sp.]